MLKNIIVIAFLMFSGFSYSDSVLTDPTPDFNESDKITVNNFCDQFIKNLIISFDTANNRDLTPEGFRIFGMTTRNKFAPGMKNFLKDLNDRGATNCIFPEGRK